MAESKQRGAHYQKQWSEGDVEEDEVSLGRENHHLGEFSHFCAISRWIKVVTLNFFPGE